MCWDRTGPNQPVDGATKEAWVPFLLLLLLLLAVLRALRLHLLVQLRQELPVDTDGALTSRPHFLTSPSPTPMLTIPTCSIPSRMRPVRHPHFNPPEPSPGSSLRRTQAYPSLSSRCHAAAPLCPPHGVRSPQHSRHRAERVGRTKVKVGIGVGRRASGVGRRASGAARSAQRAARSAQSAARARARA